jgi:hypothetical protein
MENDNFRLFATNGTKMAIFCLSAANGKEKCKFAFLGRQTINGN